MSMTTNPEREARRLYYNRTISAALICIFIVYYFQGFYPQMMMAILPATAAIIVTFVTFAHLPLVQQLAYTGLVSVTVVSNTIIKMLMHKGIVIPAPINLAVIVVMSLAIVWLFVNHDYPWREFPKHLSKLFIPFETGFDLFIVVVSCVWLYVVAYVMPWSDSVPLHATFATSVVDTFAATVYCQMVIKSKGITRITWMGAIGVICCTAISMLMPYIDMTSDVHLTVVNLMASILSLVIAFGMRSDPEAFIRGAGLEQSSPHLRVIILSFCAFSPAMATFGPDYAIPMWATVSMCSFMLLSLSMRTLIIIQRRTAAIEKINEINEELKRETTHDRLTGIANQMFLDDSLRQALEDDPTIVYAIIDVDGFKHINNTYGFEAGDEVIVLVASEMELHVGTRGLVARMSGDKFSLLLIENDIRQSAKDLVGSIVNRLPTHIVISTGHRVALSYSAGVYRSQEGDDIVSIQANAQGAAALAKQHVGSSVVESQSSLVKSPYRVNLLGFKHALSQSEIELGFSPIYSKRHELVAFHVFPVWVPVDQWTVDDLFSSMEQVDSTEVMQEWMIHVVDSWTLTYGCPIKITFPRFAYNSDEKIKRISRILMDLSEHNRSIQIDISAKYLVYPVNEAYNLIELSSMLGLTTSLSNFGEGPQMWGKDHAPTSANIFGINLDNFAHFAGGEKVVNSLITFASMGQGHVCLTGTNVRQTYGDLISQADFYEEIAVAQRMNSLQARSVWQQYGTPGYLETIGGNRARKNGDHIPG